MKGDFPAQWLVRKPLQRWWRRGRRWRTVHDGRRADYAGRGRGWPRPEPLLSLRHDDDAWLRGRRALRWHAEGHPAARNRQRPLQK